MFEVFTEVSGVLKPSACSDILMWSVNKAILKPYVWCAYGNGFMDGGLAPISDHRRQLATDLKNVYKMTNIQKWVSVGSNKKVF